MALYTFDALLKVILFKNWGTAYSMWIVIIMCHTNSEEKIKNKSKV